MRPFTAPFNMYCINLLLSAIFVITSLVWSHPALAQKRLEGSVEHSEKLSPLDDSLRPGRVFDQGSFANVRPDYEWFQIPDWLAGLWYTRTERGDYRDIRSGRYAPPATRPRSDKHLFGMQTDNKGEVWHCVVLPRKHTVSSD